MSRSTKLILDLLMGAVVPILALSYLTGPLGAVPAYLISALVPVSWVAIDLLLITRRFNFITSYVGLSAIMRGALAFWFVDGALFAAKDSAGNMLATLIFGGSLLLDRPAMQYFLMQQAGTATDEDEAVLATALRKPEAVGALRRGTLVIALTHAVTTVANFVLNLRIVTAPFGTELFNMQVAQVNVITRIALSVPEMLAFGIAIWLAFRAIDFSRLVGDI